MPFPVKRAVKWGGGRVLCAEDAATDAARMIANDERYDE